MAAIDDYIRCLGREDKSYHTLNNYLVNLRLFARWFAQANGKPMRPNIVTPLDVKEFRRYMQAQRFAPGTINQRLIVLKGFFRWAVSQGLAVSNPVERVKLVKQAERSTQWLSRQETYALLRTLSEQTQVAELKKNLPSWKICKKNQAMVALMLQAGLRVSEVLVLTRDDIVIRPRSGLVIVRNGKGGKYREVPLNLDARLALSDWLQICQGNLLFGAEGKPLHVRTVQYHLGRLGRLAGLSRKLTPHQLRHTFGKNLVDAGVSLDRVARLMGHTSVETTSIYTMPSRADLQAAVERVAWEE